MSLLEINAIDACYGKSHTIRDLSMSVKESEICALLGRNGAGKTTTLRCIASMTPPEVQEGAIRFKDDDITGVPTENVSVRGISLVPKEQRIFPNLFATESFHLTEVVNSKSDTFGRSLSPDYKGMSTEEVYDQFPRLNEWRDQCMGMLSGGEQQVLAIARALEQNTDLLLLNEPYGRLASKIIEDVESAVERINDTDATIPFVEQDTVATIELADRAYIINQGGIVSDGTIEELRGDDETRERYLGV